MAERLRFRNPCPWCLKKDMLELDDAKLAAVHFVVCKRCEVAGPGRATPEEAVLAWESRWSDIGGTMLRLVDKGLRCVVLKADHYPPSPEPGPYRVHVLKFPPDDETPTVVASGRDLANLSADLMESEEMILDELLGDGKKADVPRCPKCGHAPHSPGMCFNMASDNDCDCQGGEA